MSRKLVIVNFVFAMCSDFSRHCAKKSLFKWNAVCLTNLFLCFLDSYGKQSRGSLVQIVQSHLILFM